MGTIEGTWFFPVDILSKYSVSYVKLSSPLLATLMKMVTSDPLRFHVKAKKHRPVAPEGRSIRPKLSAYGVTDEFCATEKAS
jgi:hypothetical protein